MYANLHRPTTNCIILSFRLQRRADPHSTGGDQIKKKKDSALFKLLKREWRLRCLDPHPIK